VPFKVQHIIVLFFVLLAGKSLAQPRLEHPEMYVGVQGGAVASMVNFTPTVSQKATQCHLGSMAGLVFRYSADKCCAVQVELNYMQRGWRENQTGYDRSLDFIQLPFFAHIYFGKRARGFFNLGPQIGVLIHESNNGLDQSALPQYNPVQHKFDWGAAAGLGFLYRTKKAGTYQLEARFNYSFGHLFSNDKTAYFSQSNSMNLSLGLAWFWQVKGDR